MVTMYGIKNCDTVKRARKRLETHIGTQHVDEYGGPRGTPSVDCRVMGFREGEEWLVSHYLFGKAPR
jgi:hypothetical protein